MSVSYQIEPLLNREVLLLLRNSVNGYRMSTDGSSMTAHAATAYLTVSAEATMSPGPENLCRYFAVLTVSPNTLHISQSRLARQSGPCNNSVDHVRPHYQAAKEGNTGQ